MRTIYENERFRVNQSETRTMCVIEDKWADSHPSIALPSRVVTVDAMDTTFKNQDNTAYRARQVADRMLADSKPARGRTAPPPRTYID